MEVINMAKDDYHVIVYQILAYLYQRLKKGETADESMLKHDGHLFKIDKSYWAYIIFNMYETGLITGVSFVYIDGLNVPLAAELNECCITPAGIEYLCDNTFMEKAKRFLKDVKEIVPFT